MKQVLQEYLGCAEGGVCGKTLRCPGGYAGKVLCEEQVMVPCTGDGTPERPPVEHRAPGPAPPGGRGDRLSRGCPDPSGSVSTS